MTVPVPVPAAVARARRAAASLGFDQGCSEATGRLLAAVASAVPGARTGESGTGIGEGTAWLLSGLDPAASLVTAEIDPQRASTAAATLRDDPRAVVLVADRRALEAHGPFDLLFCDEVAGKSDPDAIIALLAPGGILVLDDFSPPAGARPPTFDGAVDTLRLRYLEHPLLSTVEVTVSADEVVIVGARTIA